MDQPIKVVPRQLSVLEAWQVTRENIDQIAKWSHASWDEDEYGPHLILVDQTGDGCEYAHIGDWVLRGVTGHFFPRSFIEFERTYAQVEIPS